MPTVNSKSTTTLISKLYFHEPPDYKVEVFSADRAGLESVSGRVRALKNLMYMEGVFCEFDVLGVEDDEEELERVFITGNIHQAIEKLILWMNDSSLMDQAMVNDIYSDNEIKCILEKAKDYYEELNNRPDDDLSELEITPHDSSCATFFKLVQEHKEQTDLVSQYRSIISKFYLREKNPTPAKLMAALTAGYSNPSSPELNQLAREFSFEMEEKTGFQETSYRKAFANAINSVFLKIKPEKHEPFVILLNYFLACYPHYKEFIDASLASLFLAQPYSLFLTIEERAEYCKQAVSQIEFSFIEDRVKLFLAVDNDFCPIFNLLTYQDDPSILPAWYLEHLSKHSTPTEQRAYLEAKFLRVEEILEKSQIEEIDDLNAILSLMEMEVLIPIDKYGMLFDLLHALLLHCRVEIRRAAVTTLHRLSALIAVDYKPFLITAVIKIAKDRSCLVGDLLQVLSPQIYASCDEKQALVDVAMENLASEDLSLCDEGLKVLKVMRSALTPISEEKICQIIDRQLKSKKKKIRRFTKMALTELRSVLPAEQISAAMSIIVESFEGVDERYLTTLWSCLSLENQREFIDGLAKVLGVHSGINLAQPNKSLIFVLVGCSRVMTTDELEALAEDLLLHVCRIDYYGSYFKSYSSALEQILTQLSTTKSEQFIERLIARLEASREGGNALSSFAVLMNKFIGMIGVEKAENTIKAIARLLKHSNMPVVYYAISSLYELAEKGTENVGRLAVHHLMRFVCPFDEYSSHQLHAANSLARLEKYVLEEDKHLLIASALAKLNQKSPSFGYIIALAPLVSPVGVVAVIEAILEKLGALSQVPEGTVDFPQAQSDIASGAKALAEFSGKIPNSLLEKSVSLLIKQLVFSDYPMVNVLRTLLQDLCPSRWNYYFYGVLGDQLQTISKEHRHRLLEVMAPLSFERQQQYRLNEYLLPELSNMVVGYCRP